ncbi:probable mediator of RNA polymerase II transcription subunit 19b [Primulina huaijiensis]|uniref:probable mediator of RNA polymerase II transcription subunit 19b n=1 Tax=Primulina huaijiensis TaxID=1492673 RepID=UPI003CC72DEA
MDPDSMKFGRVWPRELTGGQDLISLYKLLPHLDLFCKKPHTLSILDACYLYNVVGDTKIRKGEGMQLNELVHNMFSKENNTCIQPLELDVLREAFALRGTASVDSSSSEKCSRAARKRKSESKDEHKNHKVGKFEDNNVLKRHKHRHKDCSKQKEKEKHDDPRGELGD